MKKIVLIFLAVFCALPAVFAREQDLDSAEAWVGTWRRSDGGQTMTISFHGTNATISYSKGTPDTGKMRGDGEIIDFEGSTRGGLYHSTGTLVLNSDHTSITKNQTIFAQDGPEKHLQATYVRSSQARLPSTSELASSSSSSVPMPNFAGVWQSETSPEQRLTISLHGRNASIDFALGGHAKGTIRDGEIAFKGANRSGTMQLSNSGRVVTVHQLMDGVSPDAAETENYTRIR